MSTFACSPAVISRNVEEVYAADNVLRQKIHVVMNSADTRLFDAEAHPRRPFMEDGELRLIHHSNFQRIYGLDVAIEDMGVVTLDDGRAWFTSRWSSVATSRGWRRTGFEGRAARGFATLR